MTRLGWTPIEGWWTWRLLGEDEPVRLAQDPESRNMHVARESMRNACLGRLEHRRPRQFEGVGGGVIKEPVNAYLATCAPSIKKSLLMGVLTGATWMADRAHRRKLRGFVAVPVLRTVKTKG